jgi:hypothetical protein
MAARAYSGAHSLVEKDNASVESFPGSHCPEIGIIGVDEYLSMMN